MAFGGSFARTAIIEIRMVDHVSGELSGIASKISHIGSTMAQVGLATTMAISAPLAAIGGAAVKAYADYDKAMRNVQAISRESDIQIRGISDAVKNMSMDMSKSVDSPTKLMEALYQIQSAGYYAGDRMKLLGVATKLAGAGMTDTDTAATALATSLHAYSRDADEASHFADVFTRGVDLGVFKMEDLVAEMGEFNTMAGMVGLSVEEPIAAMVTLTKKGLSPSEASTSVSRMLRDVFKPSPEAEGAALSLGIKLNVEGLQEAGGLLPFLQQVYERTGMAVVVTQQARDEKLKDINAQIIQTQTTLNYERAHKLATAATENQLSALKKERDQIKGQSFDLSNLTEVTAAMAREAKANPEALAKIFPDVRALRGIVGLTADLKASYADLAGVMNSTGATEQVYETQTKSLAYQMQHLGNVVEVAKIGIGEGLAPLIQQVMGKIEPLIRNFINLDQESKASIVKSALGLIAVGPALIGVGLAISAVGQILGSIIGLFNFLGLVVRALVYPMTLLHGLFTALSTFSFAGAAASIGGFFTSVAASISGVITLFLSMNPVLFGIAVLVGLFAVAWIMNWNDIRTKTKEAVDDIKVWLDEAGVKLTNWTRQFNEWLNGGPSGNAGILHRPADVGAQIPGITPYDMAMKELGEIQQRMNELEETEPESIKHRLSHARTELADINAKLALPQYANATEDIWADFPQRDYEEKKRMLAQKADLEKEIAGIEAGEGGSPGMLGLRKRKEELEDYIETWKGKVAQFRTLVDEEKKMVADLEKAGIPESSYMKVGTGWYELDKQIGDLGAELRGILGDDAWGKLFGDQAVTQMGELSRPMDARINQVRQLRDEYDELGQHIANLKFQGDVGETEDPITAGMRAQYEERRKAVKDLMKDLLGPIDYGNFLKGLPLGMLGEKTKEGVNDFQGEAQKSVPVGMDYLKYLLETYGGSAINSAMGFLSGLLESGGATLGAALQAGLSKFGIDLGPLFKEAGPFEKAQAGIAKFLGVKSSNPFDNYLNDVQKRIDQNAAETLRKLAEAQEQGVGAFPEKFDKATDDATAKLKDRITSAINDGIDASKKLGDLTGGTYGGGPLAPGAGGPFEDIYRIQDVAQNWKEHPGADTEKWANQYFAGMSKEEASAAAKSIVKKFQLGLWEDPEVAKILGPNFIDKMADVVVMEAAATATLDRYKEAIQKVAEKKGADPAAVAKVLGTFGFGGSVPAATTTAIATDTIANLKPAIDTAAAQAADGKALTNLIVGDPSKKDSTVPSLVPQIATSFTADVTNNADKLEAAGAAVWDRLGAGIVKRASTDGTLYRAVDGMVQAVLSK